MSISRRGVEVARQLTGGLLVIYVAIIVVSTMLANGLFDIQTVLSILATLDLPTAIALVAFSILSAKLELDKPKYRHLYRKYGNIDLMLMACGILLVAFLVYLKYFW